MDSTDKKSTIATRGKPHDPSAFVVGSTWGHRARTGAMAVEVVAIDGPRLVYRHLRTGHVDSYVLARACQPSAFWPIAREVPVGQRVEIPAARPAPPPVEVESPPLVEPSSALVSRQVDGWTLFEGAGTTWVRDLDLAERAGLVVPRDIRRTIAKAIADGGLTIVGGAHDGGTPLVYAVDEVVQIGSGATRLVPTYYLNQEGALLILTRLRTPKAIEVTKAVVTVFAAAMRGEVAVAPAGLDRLAAIMERQMAASDARMDRLESAILSLAVGGSTSAAPLPAPIELIPKDWRPSASIADIVTARFKGTTGRVVTKREVDTIIEASGVRSNATLARKRRVVKADKEGDKIDVPQWMYAPPVHDMVYGAIRPLPPPKQEPLPGFVNGKGAS